MNSRDEDDEGRATVPGAVRQHKLRRPMLQGLGNRRTLVFNKRDSHDKITSHRCRSERTSHRAMHWWRCLARPIRLRLITYSEVGNLADKNACVIRMK